MLCFTLTFTVPSLFRFRPNLTQSIVAPTTWLYTRLAVVFGRAAAFKRACFFALDETANLQNVRCAKLRAVGARPRRLFFLHSWPSKCFFSTFTEQTRAAAARTRIHALKTVNQWSKKQCETQQDATTRDVDTTSCKCWFKITNTLIGTMPALKWLENCVFHSVWWPMCLFSF